MKALMNYGVMVFIFFALSLTACNNNPENPMDQTYTLSGKVTHSNTQSGVANVVVGIKDPSIADSLFFIGDSVRMDLANSFFMRTVSDSSGNYIWNWFLGGRRTDLYKNIFAYKPGYKLWHYSDESGSEVKQTGNLTDELNIKLIPK
jgi:hypothetical protein